MTSSFDASAASGENTIKATVTRQVYLGASRDYVVETADGSRCAVTRPMPRRKGASWLTCRRSLRR
jgi:iron(III) transport system ATP-binding protein